MNLDKYLILVSFNCCTIKSFASLTSLVQGLYPALPTFWRIANRLLYTTVSQLNNKYFSYIKQLIIMSANENQEAQNKSQSAYPDPFSIARMLTSIDPIGTVLDPLGKGLGTVLSPVGAVVGTVTKPVTNVVGGVTKPALGPIAGEEDQKMEVLGGKNVDSYEHGKEGLGGRVQDSENPLGLDQSGKFGFRE
jgi:hypothetical protein